MSDEAARELDRLLRGPMLLKRWPDGLTTDDLLAALGDLGTLTLGAPCEGRATYGCRLNLKDGSGGCRGSGLTLTAAALRGLLEAEKEIAGLAAEGLAEIERHLNAAA
jgi:hypothetical protein